jgi:hypothetical protein
MSESTAVVSDAVSAVTSVSGAVDAVANAPETIANIFDLAERLVYGTFYSAAFVIVFPAALLFTVLPKNNVIVRGLIDGSAAATARAERMIRK